MVGIGAVIYEQGNTVGYIGVEGWPEVLNKGGIKKSLFTVLTFAEAQHLIELRQQNKLDELSETLSGKLDDPYAITSN